MKHKLASLLILAICLGCGGAALADEISDQVQRGMDQYSEGNISKAIAELDFALGQMRQKQAEAIAKIMPEAPQGWKADKPKASSQEILGAGSVASRAYKQTSGKGRAKIEIMKLGQGLGMMFTPAMMQKMGGGKPVIIGELKGTLIAKDDNNAELTLSIGPEHILKVEVRGVDDASDVAEQFAGLLDAKTLGNALR